MKSAFTVTVAASRWIHSQEWGSRVRIFVNLLYCRCLQEITRDVRENRSLQQATYKGDKLKMKWISAGCEQSFTDYFSNLSSTKHFSVIPEATVWWLPVFVLQWKSGWTTYFNMLVIISAMLGWWSIHRWSCSRLYHVGCILRKRDILFLLWCVWAAS